MVLRLVVLLLILSLLARRFLPCYRLPWVVPLGLVAGLVAVRAVGWATSD